MEYVYMMYSGYVHKSSLMPSKTGPTWTGLHCDLCGCTRPMSNAHARLIKLLWANTVIFQAGGRTRPQ